MRVVDVKVICEKVKEALIDININQADDVKELLSKGYEREESEVAKSVIDMLKENALIAQKEKMPICQDTGMAVIFMEVGQDVHFEGGYIVDAINKGVRDAYDQGFLRKSVVSDPLNRVNSKDNTPAVIHTSLVEGDKVKLTIAAKGFGSENMSQSFMLKPADGIEGVKEVVLKTVRSAGPNPCPPIVVGVGIGGTLEMAAILAKKALTRDARLGHEEVFYRDLESDLLEAINHLDIGPQGLGGITTALGVNVEYFPTHIAGLPVVVNINCHASRHCVVHI